MTTSAKLGSPCPQRSRSDAALDHKRQSVTSAPLPVLRENDTDGRVAVLMITGYAQGPLDQTITECAVSVYAHDALPKTGKMRCTQNTADSHSIAVNHRTRIRDQERAPIAADLKRVMREKSKTDEPTFALTVDVVTEAHRQVPIAEQDWHLLGCQVRPGEELL